MKVWICPGSFDPVTAGHLDIIKRSSKMCDKLIVAVGVNDKKKPFFTIEERIRLIKKATTGVCNVEVESFEGLLIDYAAGKNANGIVKGLRAVSDFEYELQMALLNKSLAEGIETIFLMTGINYSFLSSSIVKELAANGGDITGLVPDCILDDIKGIFKKRR
jgi:pantetheine-phosphate adenylyltransferase